MTTVCITGSTDGIGFEAARILSEDGHRVIVHARSRERGENALRRFSGDVGLVVADLADDAAVRDLPRQIGSVDVLVHNAGVWARTPLPRTPSGLEPTFAINVIAPHLLTTLMHDQVRSRILFLGSGLAANGRVDPAELGAEVDPESAYANSKALDVLLAVAWARRRPDLRVGAVDPGWVVTKLAGPLAPGTAAEGGERIAAAATDPSWHGGYTKGLRPIDLPKAVTDPDVQETVIRALDRVAGVVG
ncbi:SDR family NAD(P)-dependent oxidoreductase [Leifsonia shinshuensis]|uniref:SDR family NAD(P)-dependent oxidoreductase n=1 Tax=Leifsonia shinshuensis TaxID=150026 RepID=UPI0028621298|nr:SDR family NAD(P)-dependent oxidoreductase [Leifsonia shinshuensis]MDR6972708.1 NAD(P)-dependent dehydrogenase (short-subunit alcohol dehydrogenase family) [Leifsonia shinshuensis]